MCSYAWLICRHYKKDHDRHNHPGDMITRTRGFVRSVVIDLLPCHIFSPWLLRPHSTIQVSYHTGNGLSRSIQRQALSSSPIPVAQRPLFHTNIYLHSSRQTRNQTHEKHVSQTLEPQPFKRTSQKQQGSQATKNIFTSAYYLPGKNANAWFVWKKRKMPARISFVSPLPSPSLACSFLLLQHQTLHLCYYEERILYGSDSN